MNQLALDLVSDRKRTALIFFETRPELFRADFGEWLRKNWPIFEAFDRRANRLWNAGVRHAGARMIGEVIRYQTTLRETDGEFKVNDWYWPDCARLWMLLYADRKGFFETRSGVSAKRAA